jgi:enoyl-CoA hydratase/carnithine racemase
MGSDFLQVRVEEGVALLTMNSPETRNVLGFGGPSREIEAACAEIAGRPRSTGGGAHRCRQGVQRGR